MIVVLHSFTIGQSQQFNVPLQYFGQPQVNQQFYNPGPYSSYASSIATGQSQQFNGVPQSSQYFGPSQLNYGNPSNPNNGRSQIDYAESKSDGIAFSGGDEINYGPNLYQQVHAAAAADKTHNYQEVTNADQSQTVTGDDSVSFSASQAGFGNPGSVGADALSFSAGHSYTETVPSSASHS